MTFFNALRMNLQMNWSGLFKREESDLHATKAAFGFLCGMGTATITRVIRFHNEDQRDWTSTYKFFSESPWNEQELFEGVVPQLVEKGSISGPYIRMAPIGGVVDRVLAQIGESAPAATAATPIHADRSIDI